MASRRGRPPRWAHPTGRQVPALGRRVLQGRTTCGEERPCPGRNSERLADHPRANVTASLFHTKYLRAAQNTELRPCPRALAWGCPDTRCWALLPSGALFTACLLRPARLHSLPDPDFPTSPRPQMPAHTSLPTCAAQNFLRMLSCTRKKVIKETSSLFLRGLVGREQSLGPS